LESAMVVVVRGDCGCGCDEGKQLEEEEEFQMDDDVVEEDPWTGVYSKWADCNGT
jgi:hypothetical protein